jgi:recombination protein RecA
MSKETTKPQNAEKLKALQLTMDKIEKSYGKGAIMKLGDSAVVPVESISTGSLSLDIALGVGGLPRGRVIEIYGPESSGKTTLAIHAIAEAQKRAALPLSLMPNMPSTAAMPRNWAWI